MNPEMGQQVAVCGGGRQQVTEGTTTTSVVPTDPATGRGPRILIVEDDGAFANILARFLEGLGVEVTVVGTVRAATAHLQNAKAWAAFTVDVSLVDGSGLDFVSLVRAAHCSSPVLVLTGVIDRDVANAAFGLQAAYMVKPVTMHQLEEWARAVTTAKGQPLHSRTVVPGDLPDDLQKLADEARRAAAAERNAHAEYVYRVTSLARAQNCHPQTTCGLLETCARAINMSRSSFQEYAAVTARWSPSEIRVLLERRDGRGHPITLSHLLRIVRAPRASRSQLEQILRGGGDTRQLRRVRTHRLGSCANKPPAGDDPSP